MNSFLMRSRSVNLMGATHLLLQVPHDAGIRQTDPRRPLFHNIRWRRSLERLFVHGALLENSDESNIAYVKIRLLNISVIRIVLVLVQFV